MIEIENHKIGKLFIYLLLVLVLVSCNDDSEDVKEPTVSSRLVSSEFIFTRSSGDIAGLISASGSDLPVDKIRYNVQMWKVEYLTSYKGQAVNASGLLFIPEKDESSSLVSFQHGTITSNDEAPSELPINDIQITLFSALASTGFITVVPDFIGFGSSSDIMHPYYVEDPSADAVLDNLRAAVEVANENNFTSSPRVYLAGYSQGGYVTMAAHKAFEENEVEFFELQASYPASGGYMIEGVRDFFFENETYHQPYYLAYVAEAYRTYYDEGENFLSTLFQQQYADIIPGLFDGTLNGEAINDLLTDTVANLVNPSYLSDPGSSQFFFINGKFQDNSPINWIPEIPMNMYHGDADVTVPYQNSVDTYNFFINNGASENIVTFTPIPGGTHASGIEPFIESFFNDIIEKEGF